MTVGGFLRGATAFIILVALHYSLRPLLGWRASIDFLLIAVLLIAVRVRPGTAALLGFAVGLASDSLAPAGFGAGALGMTATAFAASYLKAVFFADNIALNGFFFFAGEWAFRLIYAISERRLRGVELVMELFLWSPLAAAATALTGIAMLLVLRPLIADTRT